MSVHTLPRVDTTETLEVSAPTAPVGLGDLVLDAAERQGTAVIGVLRRSDPQAWLFAERARFLSTGTCDAYAEQLLRRAGFLRD